jgi:hypothetical protein
MHFYKDSLVLTLGQPLATGIAGLISGSIGIRGRETYGADVCVITFALMTAGALLVDVYFNRLDRSNRMVSRLIMLCVLIGLIIIACIQATDVAVNVYSFAAMIVFASYVIIVTLVQLLTSIREELRNKGR